MLKNYRVTVNGTAYDVSVEETGAASSPQPVIQSVAQPAAMSAPVAKPAAAPAPAAKPAAMPAAAPQSGNPVIAPMPGTILDVKVSVGDTVKENQVVIILEAMKMENEIVTPYAGKVTAVVASKGDSVNSGDVFITVA